MSKGKPKNLPASVSNRLRQLAKDRAEDFQLVLIRYALERLLYRLSRSGHRELFVLKGALLFQLWGGQSHRPTRDLDLLGRGAASVERFGEVFRELCALDVEADGLELRSATVKGELMKEDQDYQGVRLSMMGQLQNMPINIDIDIGTGDAITPAPVEVTYPVLLDFPAPVLLAYPRETVVAEKFQAMTALGMGNSRMKDFYDLWVLASRFQFHGAILSQAIRATFESRRTDLPGAAPLALTEAFYRDSVKVTQWQAFLRKSKLDAQGTSFEQVGDVLRAFLMPPTEGARAGGGFSLEWLVGGPWSTPSPAGGPAGPSQA